MIWKNKYLIIKILILSIICVGSLFLWQWNKGFSLADEGYLWYGVQRVMAGEVPLRDFFSYDPGRYYLCSSIMWFLGSNSIIALRIAVASVQLVGLFVALILIARNVSKQQFLYLLLSAITLLAWMWPYHKIFDITISILLIAILSSLVEKPVKRNYFFAGLFIGLIAFFGRNHGLYGGVAGLGVICWLHLKAHEGISFLYHLFLYGVGVIIGFIPILLMGIFIKGFGAAFIESIRYLFEIKATNISLPIPWPWLANFSLPLQSQSIRSVLIGCCFVAFIIFGGALLIWICIQKANNKKNSPELVAATFLIIPYTHYAYSRADIGHLAISIFPLLISLLIIVAQVPLIARWLLVSLLCIGSIWIVYIYFPGTQRLVDKTSASIEVSNNKLIVDQQTAQDIELLRRLANQYMTQGGSFLVVPFWPGAYALFNQRAPIFNTYPLLPRTNVSQQKEIERIKTSNVRFVLLLDIPLDGREDLRFKKTNPLIYDYILKNFVPIKETENTAYLIYKRKN